MKEVLTREEKYMKEALKEARKAAANGDVPIGCVIVYEDKIIGRGYNRRMKDKTALAHAEILAIKKACKAMGDWRLDEAEIYITLEPCQMCAGAIIQSRIRKVYIGAMNPKAGCAGSIINLFEEPSFNHHPLLYTGILADRCSVILKEFFQKLRSGDL
ncbi:MAG: nucleoside deaminase [Parasporobacterium sp.]|nr:nucleoside deaminase [Parasporobacterium sp.]